MSGETRTSLDSRTLLFPDHPEWAIQTARLLAQVPSGGADVFDITETAGRIVPGDPQSWQSEWQALGDRMEALAHAALSLGRTRTAMRLFFQAGSYFRQSDFFLAGKDPRKRRLFERSRACFLKAAARHVPAVRTIEVACGDDRYHGYFHAPVSARDAPVPAVLMIGGADSLAEELFLLTGPELVNRGAAIMLVDTPGRGSTLRIDGIPARADYEVPVSAAVDHMASLAEVDTARMGVLGISLGGYYGPRAAAFEKRFKAMALWCGCYDVLTDLYLFYPPIRGQMQWILGVGSDREARTVLRDFNLKGIAEQITCPTLISHAAGDTLMDPAGARRLYDAIPGEDKEFRLWPADAGGAMHCSWDSLNVVLPHMLDWLMEQL